MENNSNVTKYFVLLELGRRKMSGYDIMAYLEKITGKRPSASQIYPLLKNMKSSGYVAVKTEATGKKKVFSYTLTKQGRELLKTMNVRFESMFMSFLKDKIKVCAHCNCEIIKGAYSKKIDGRLQYFCCSSCAASYRH